MTASVSNEEACLCLDARPAREHGPKRVSSARLIIPSCSHSKKLNSVCDESDGRVSLCSAQTATRLTTARRKNIQPWPTSQTMISMETRVRHSKRRMSRRPRTTRAGMSPWTRSRVKMTTVTQYAACYPMRSTVSPRLTKLQDIDIIIEKAPAPAKPTA